MSASVEKLTPLLKPTSTIVGYVVTLLFLAQIMSNVDRMALAVLLPAIKREFLLSDVQLGLLTGIAYSVSYAVIGIPIARLADRGNRRNILGWSVIAWSLMTAATGVANSFWHLFVARVGIGVGEAGCVPPSHSMIVDLVPRSRRSAVFGVYTVAQPLGSMLGLALGGWLGALVGWRWTFQVFGLAGLALAILFLCTTSEPQRTVAARQAIASRQKLGASLKILMARRSYAFLLMGLAFAGFAVTGISNWLPSYYIRTFGSGAGLIGVYFGLAYGVGATLGIFVGGFLGDRLSARDARWPLWIATAAYVFSLPIMVAAIYATNLHVAMVLIFVGFAILSSPYAPVYAMVQEVSPPHLRALAVSLTLFASAIIGSGLGPVLIGYVSDVALAHAASNPLRIGLFGGLAFFPLPAIFYFWGSHYVNIDTRSALIEEEHG